MAKKIQDDTGSNNETDEGHVDIRTNNFECKDNDPHLGCDMGIDVQE
jgi:hypothetical protein